MIRFYIYTLLILLISSCKKDEVTDPTPKDEGIIISGTIISWNMGDTMTIRAQDIQPALNDGNPFIFGSSKVGGDGKFTIMVSNPPTEYLAGYISDLSRSYLSMGYLRLYKPNGEFYKSVFNANNPNGWTTFAIGDYISSYIYSNKESHITDTSKGWSGTPPNVDTVYYCTDLYLVKGWNKTEHKVLSHNGNVTYRLSIIQNFNTGNWYIANY